MYSSMAAEDIFCKFFSMVVMSQLRISINCFFLFAGSLTEVLIIMIASYGLSNIFLMIIQNLIEDFYEGTVVDGREYFGEIPRES